MVSIHNQIECDLHNIQEMINLLPNAKSKGEYRSIGAAVKILVKEIHNQKCLIEDKMFDSKDKVKIPLFEVEPSKIDIITEYSEMSSFFGKLDK